MKLDESIAQLPAQTQQFHRQYGANALLPSIDWAQMFKYSKLDDTQIQALETLYQHAVPLALQVLMNCILMSLNLMPTNRKV